MRVLYIGGTGEISYDCIHESVRLGHDVHVYNRGGPRNKTLPREVTFHVGDIHDDAAYSKLADHHFDAICQFRLFTVSEIERDIAFFTGHCGQYVFISTASAYQKPLPPGSVLITEERTPLDNPYWPYSQAKTAMEALLRSQDDLPYTIVRPSHTYRTHFPTPINHKDSIPRLLRGKPVLIPGDGESLWTVTHARDFAPPFVKLLGNRRALGEAFHLTSNHAWPWNHILDAIAQALNVANYRLVHVPTDTLIRYKPEWIGPVKGDKCVSALFDNSKIKSVVGDFDCPTDPWTGMKLVAAAFPPDPSAFDPREDALQDRIAAEQSALGL